MVSAAVQIDQFHPAPGKAFEGVDPGGIDHVFNDTGDHSLQASPVRSSATGRLDGLPGHVRHPVMDSERSSTGQSPAGGLNPSAHRNGAAPAFFRVWCAGRRGPCGRTSGTCLRSLPEGHSGREQWRLRSCSSKVSGANDAGAPNGEPTTTGIRPRQATSSHGPRWWMARRATSSHVQPP